MPKSVKRINFTKITFVLMDLDGVMSDGSLIYMPDGQRLKIFSVYDGFGIERGRIHGLRFGVITGKIDDVNRERAKRLKVEEMHEGIDDKLAAYERIRKKYNLKAENFCFIGDDVFDLPLLRGVAFSCAPANAMDEVKKEVHYVTKREGGKGAVREVIDFILRKKGVI